MVNDMATQQNPDCPACYKNKLELPLVRNALSRTDNKTYICNECGDKEAWSDMARYKKQRRGMCAYCLQIHEEGQCDGSAAAEVVE